MIGCGIKHVYQAFHEKVSHLPPSAISGFTGLRPVHTNICICASRPQAYSVLCMNVYRLEGDIVQTEQISPSHRDESHCCRGSIEVPPESASCSGCIDRKQIIDHVFRLFISNCIHIFKCSQIAGPTWPLLRCTQTRRRLS